MTAGIVVVGASLGGLRSAEHLRAAGYAGAITVVGEESHLPYNRPPLSKELLADTGDDDAVRLHEAVAFRRKASVADVEFRLGSPATTADLGARTVTTADGTVLSWEALVVATGLRPRRLDLPGPVTGRHTLRTLDDLIALRPSARTSRTAVVVGGGFIGCETAGTLLKAGLDVTVVEPYGAPLQRVLGAEPAAAVQRHLERHGVTFVLGTPLDHFTGSDVVTGVALADGRVLPADLVVESVGSVCNTEWLAGTGLDLTDGVLCDNRLLAVGAERVAAVGDIARFPNPLFDDVPRRVEHWSMPSDTAKRAARSLLAELGQLLAGDEVFAPVPSFWSDQVDLRLQSFGSPGLADRHVVEEGNLDDLTDGVLITYHRGAQHVGTLAINLTPARQRGLREAFLPLASTS